MTPDLLTSSTNLDVQAGEFLNSRRRSKQCLSSSHSLPPDLHPPFRPLASGQPWCGSFSRVRSRMDNKLQERSKTTHAFDQRILQSDKITNDTDWKECVGPNFKHQRRPAGLGRAKPPPPGLPTCTRGPNIENAESGRPLLLPVSGSVGEGS